MANDFVAMGSAIYSVLNAAGTVSVYQDIAPQGGTPPYAIFGRLVANDTHHMAAGESGVDADYMVKVISNRTYSGEAQTIYGHLHDAMDNAALSVSGYTLLRCRRDSTLSFRDDEEFWHVGGIYGISIHE